MSDARRQEEELRELAERFGLRLVRMHERWFATPRGRIRAAAWTALGALFVLVCPATLLFSVSETAAVIVAAASGAVLLLALAAVYVEVFARRGRHAEEEEENERAVARMVSGRGVRPRR